MQFDRARASRVSHGEGEGKGEGLDEGEGLDGLEGLEGEGLDEGLDEGLEGFDEGLEGEGLDKGLDGEGLDGEGLDEGLDGEGLDEGLDEGLEGFDEGEGLEGLDGEGREDLEGKEKPMVTFSPKQLAAIIAAVLTAATVLQRRGIDELSSRNEVQIAVILEKTDGIERRLGNIERRLESER